MHGGIRMAAVTLAAVSALGLATTSAASAAVQTATTHSHASVPAYTPPPGFIYYGGNTYDNWLDCNLAGTGGVAIFRWEGYQCFQNDFGKWDLWVHPW